MLTPLVMLALMTGPWMLAGLRSRRRGRPSDSRRAGSFGLFLLFVFTGLGHFLQPEPMAGMLPPWVPARVALVYLSGILELALAAGFATRRWRRQAGWAAAALLVAFFPVNVYAAINHVPMGGHAWGPEYLLIRGPLQLAMLAWVYWFTIRNQP